MSAPMPSGQREAIARQLGDVKPATDDLISSFAEAVANVRDHEHPSWEDLYCMNLTSYMGERMAPVLRRLLDAEADVRRWRERTEEAETAEAQLRGQVRGLKSLVTELEGQVRGLAVDAMGALPMPTAGDLAEQRHLVDELDHVLEHLADEKALPGFCPSCKESEATWCPDCACCRLGCFDGNVDNTCTHPNAVWTVAAVVLPAQRDRGTAL